MGGETRLEFALDPAALARHEVDPALARATADLFLTGGRLGQMRVPDLALTKPVLIPADVRTGAAGHHHTHGGGAEAESPAVPENAVASPAAPPDGIAAGPVPREPVPVRISLAARWHPKPPDQLLRDVTVRGGGGNGQPVPLALLGRPRFVSEPAQLRAEHGGLGRLCVRGSAMRTSTSAAMWTERARRWRARWRAAGHGLVPASASNGRGNTSC